MVQLFVCVATLFVVDDVNRVQLIELAFGRFSWLAASLNLLGSLSIISKIDCEVPSATLRQQHSILLGF